MTEDTENAPEGEGIPPNGGEDPRHLSTYSSQMKFPALTLCALLATAGAVADEMPAHDPQIRTTDLHEVHQPQRAQFAICRKRAATAS